MSCAGPSAIPAPAVGRVGAAACLGARTGAARRRRTRRRRVLPGVRGAAAAGAPHHRRSRARARGGDAARGRRRRDRTRLSGRRARSRVACLSRTRYVVSSAWSRRCGPSGTRCWSRGGTAWPRCWRARSPGAHDGWQPRAPGAAFADLHHTVHWRDDALYVEPTGKTAADVDLAGRGLLLVPAAFTWPLVWPRTDPPWDPALVYTLPGVGKLWAPQEHSVKRTRRIARAQPRACAARRRTAHRDARPRTPTLVSAKRCQPASRRASAGRSGDRVDARGAG